MTRSITRAIRARFLSFVLGAAERETLRLGLEMDFSCSRYNALNWSRAERGLPLMTGKDWAKVVTKGAARARARWGFAEAERADNREARLADLRRERRGA